MLLYVLLALAVIVFDAWRTAPYDAVIVGGGPRTPCPRLGQDRVKPADPRATGGPRLRATSLP